MKIYINVEIIIIVCILITIIYGHILYSCVKTNNPYVFIEGFKENLHNAVDFIKITPTGSDSGSKPKPKQSATTTKEGFSKYKHVSGSGDGTNGEMLMFANTPFKPSCCPSSYSSSMGCACITYKQNNFIRNRGGNNVPYSEY